MTVYSNIMSLPIPVVALLILSSLILYISIRSFVDYRKLRQFRGPPLAAVSGLWLWKQSLARRMHIAQAEVLRKYGTNTDRAFGVVMTDQASPQVLLHALGPIYL
jgi:hypothetical protein